METIHLTEGQLSQISETDTLVTVPGVKWQTIAAENFRLISSRCHQWL
jgi:hypothetical protein